MHFRFVNLLCLLALASPAAQAAPKPAVLPSAEPWLATAARTRADLLARLAPKAAQPPYDKILSLLTKAQAELAKPAPADKRAAIGDAYDAYLLVQIRTDDHALAADVFDGFLLPALRFADPDPALYDGKRHLLKAAVGTYGQAGREDRELAALRLLRREAADDENLSDWVSLQFAAVYGRRGQYQPAMDALGEVRTPGMMGETAFMPQMQQEQEEKKQQQEDKRLAAQSVRPKTGAKRARKTAIKH